MIIIATSGYAGEVAGMAASRGRDVTAICGLGGPNGAATTADVLGVPYIELGEDLAGLPQGEVLLTLGHNDERAALDRRLAELGRVPETLVHADTTIGPAVEMGAGTLVSPGARITANVQIGRCGLVHTNAVLSHDDMLGDYVTISPSVTLCGGVTVEERAWIAAGATVLPGVTIGVGAIVGAGAMVHRDVAAGSTVAGVPAKPIT